jgi:ketosteroid isomerase-like protein
MKNLRMTITSFVVLMAFISITNCKQNNKEIINAETPKVATVEELGEMNRNFAKALMAKDATAAANLYTETASLLPPNEAIITGRENIKNYWQGAIDAGLIAASVKTIDAKNDGNLGYEIGTFELKFQAEDGSIVTDIGKYTEILERDANGKWISIYGMWSANAPAPVHE